MPAVIQEYKENKSLLLARRMQSTILATYRGDFGKYANVAEHESTLGIKISQATFQREKKVASLPFYLASELQRLIQSY